MQKKNAVSKNPTNVSVREKVEEKLKTSEERFRLLSEAAEEGIAIHDNGVIVEANEALARMFGYELSEMIGMNAESISTPESFKMIREHIFTEYDKPYEGIGVRKDGSTFVCSLVGKPYKYKNRILRVAVLRDITERKNAEKSLRESEERYRLLTDNVTDAIFTTDMNFNYTYASPSAYNIVGYTTDEFITLRVEQLVEPETLSWFAEMFAEELEIENRADRDLKRSRVLEYQHVRKDGSKVWVETKLTFLRNENNAAIGMLGIVRDITTRKQTEEKLLFEGQRFRALAEQSSDIIIVVNQELAVTYENPAIERILGFKAEERMGVNVFDLLHPDDLKSVTAAYHELFSNINTPVQRSEIRLRHQDGSWRIFEAVASNLVQDNVVGAVIVNLRDITERKNAEAELLQEQQFSKLLLNNLPGIFCLCTYPENRLVLWNRQIETLLGFNTEEIKGHLATDWVAPESLETVLKAIEAVMRKGQDSMEISLIAKDGHPIPFFVTGVRFEIRSLSYFIVIGTDITERRESEKLLKKSEAQYRLLADHMKDQIWIMDLNLATTYISPSVEKLLGYNLEQIKQLSLDKILTVQSLQAAMDFFSTEMSKALAAPPTYLLTRSLELEFICKDGRILWIECAFSFIRDENGKPLSILGEGRNITERKQMEDSLKKSEENFRHSLDDSPLGVRISTAIGETIYANRAILDIYGYDSIEELKETSLKDRYTPESYAEFQIRKEKRLRGEPGPSEYEVSIVRKDGEIRHLHVLRKEIFWSGKKLSQVIYQDITLRRQAEKKLNDILENLRQSIKTTIQVLGTASEARDPYTAGHQKRVANLARAIATEMKLPHDKIEAIRMAGAIHDIGKIS
ncbi:MAG: hypothetical protein CVU55_14930, partial [Deltaproteobacteria bacterium HGW-Deltaproteobacteria-13]